VHWLNIVIRAVYATGNCRAGEGVDFVGAFRRFTRPGRRFIPISRFGMNDQGGTQRQVVQSLSRRKSRRSPNSAKSATGSTREASPGNRGRFCRGRASAVFLRSRGENLVDKTNIILRSLRVLGADILELREQDWLLFAQVEHLLEDWLGLHRLPVRLPPQSGACSSPLSVSSTASARRDSCSSKDRICSSASIFSLGMAGVLFVCVCIFHFSLVPADNSRPEGHAAYCSWLSYLESRAMHTWSYKRKAGQKVCIWV
jgi:hypothetical protein